MDKNSNTYNLKVFDTNSKKVTEHILLVEKELHKSNKNTIWNTKFDFNEQLIECHEQYYLSDAINEIRKILEPNGFRILIKCCDHDAAHSAIQADMSAGTSIYKLNDIARNGKRKSYHILEESDINSVATLEEQKKNTEKLQSNQEYNAAKKTKEREKFWWKFW